jgi:uncharacterized protein YbjT (DUF2867 family)
VGKVLSEALLERGHKVRAIGRDAGRLQPLVDKGAEACVGSIDDASFLARCFDGADAAFLMIPTDIANTDQLGRARTITGAYVTAVKESGLKSAVLLSSVGADVENTGIVDTLRILEQGFEPLEDVNLRILRPAYFLDNIWPQADLIKNMGFVGGPLVPDLKQPMVYTGDIGVVAADRLDDRSWSGHSVEYVLGADDYSYNDVAAALGRAMGQQLNYVQVPDGDMRMGLSYMGASNDMIDNMLGLSHAINERRVVATRTPENTTPTTLDDFAGWFAAAYK